jgi:hypothetical protein
LAEIGIEFMLRYIPSLVYVSIETEKCRKRAEQTVFEHFKSVTALLCVAQASPLAVTCESRCRQEPTPSYQHGRYCQLWANQVSRFVPYLEVNYQNSRYALYTSRIRDKNLEARPLASGICRVSYRITIAWSSGMVLEKVLYMTSQVQYL